VKKRRATMARRRLHHLVLAAFARAATASAELIDEFMNLAMTSNMAPWVAEGTAMPCASEGTRVPALLDASMSAIDFSAQSSNLSFDTPERTGIEPLFRLNTDWKEGVMMALARAIWPFFASALFCWNMAKESILKV